MKTGKSKPMNVSELPSVEEIIGPLRKLLDYLDQESSDDWDKIPQYVALQSLVSQYDRLGQILIWLAQVAIAEKEFGPMPRLERAAHPISDDLNDRIDELKELAEKGGGHTDELRYQQARNRLLKEPDVAARAPASLKTAVSLRAFKEQINLVMGDCTDDEIKSDVIYDEFRHLSEWLRGELIWGSTEWIALHTWLVKMNLLDSYRTMNVMRMIRDAVIARVPDRAKRQHWDRFVETEFKKGSPQKTEKIVR